MLQFHYPVYTLVVLLLSKTTAAAEIFRPVRLSYVALLNDNGGFDPVAFKDAMTRVGMISVTGLFSSTEEARQSKKDTLAYLHECAFESNFSEIHTFQDGTVRRTLPTHSIPNGIQAFPKMNEKESESCQKFVKSSYVFRGKVAEATTAFANRLLSVLDSQRSHPLLKTEGGYPFDTVADVVENGEHLEHFHSYQRQNSKKNKEDSTIEWHTDQGLFIAFTPGRKVHCKHHTDSSVVTGGFSILQEDGTESQVQFDDDDDLIFMLGDGVNQYINSKDVEAIKLRAVPHSLSMPDHEDDEARVWYGRMVLPPFDAVHPDHDITFGDLRKRVNHGAINHGSDDAALSLACSGNSIARNLEEEEEMSCESNSIMCWHRCMEIAAYNVSADICASQGKVMNCTNPRGQLSDGNHGDFYPGCLKADAIIATPYPQLPEYPRNVFCSDTDFEEFAGASSFDFSFDLPEGEQGGSGALLMWSIVDGGIRGRIAFNDLFGWLALGFAGPEGAAKNGMHGGEIIMALPGGNYSAVTGLDLSMEPNVNEYMISDNPDESSFRFWATPVTATTRSSSGSTSVSFTDCFTKMDFNISGIAGRAFNLTGTDDLIWGANGVDYFAGYHLANRARFLLNWSNGTGIHITKAEVAPEPSTTPAPAPAKVPAPTPTGGTSGAISVYVPSWVVAVAVICSFYI